tara:strand:- start:321 stop:839 length:519 start_codon:yes stop_codon:yes gene_type:complete
MQIRRASFPAEALQPPCPFAHEDQPCLHSHGHYERYAQPEGSGKTRIVRFLCKFTGKTISVLPDALLPYRSINVPDVQEHFDQLTSSNQEQASPEQSEAVRDYLDRTWKRFSRTDRATSLTDFFGQRLPQTAPPRALWKAMRHAAGNLSQILLELAAQGKSLLGDYRCLRQG